MEVTNCTDSAVLYRAMTSYFVCGLLVDWDGRVVRAAPIMAWAVGKPINVVRKWVISKQGGLLEPILDEE